MADRSSRVKALVLKAEDARLMADMPRMMRNYDELMRVNEGLIAEYNKRATNHEGAIAASRRVEAPSPQYTTRVHLTMTWVFLFRVRGHSDRATTAMLRAGARGPEAGRQVSRPRNYELVRRKRGVVADARRTLKRAILRRRLVVDRDGADRLKVGFSAAWFESEEWPVVASPAELARRLTPGLTPVARARKCVYGATSASCGDGAGGEKG